MPLDSEVTRSVLFWAKFDQKTNKYHILANSDVVP